MRLSVKFPGKRARIAVGVTLAFILLAAIPVVDQVYFRLNWAEHALDDLEVRHARLLGIREAAPQLQEALGQAEGLLMRYAYPVEMDANRIAADVLQRVRRIAEGVGLEVVGSQMMGASQTDALETIPVRITLNADIGGLYQLLHALSTDLPLIQVDGMTVGASSQRTGAPVGKLRVQLNLSAQRIMP